MENVKYEPALSPDTAKMFALIAKINDIHAELETLYKNTYFKLPDEDEATQALYTFQNFWLERAHDVMCEHFWTNPNVL